MGKQLPVQGLTLANTRGEYAAPGKLAEGGGFEPMIRKAGFWRYRRLFAQK